MIDCHAHIGTLGARSATAAELSAYADELGLKRLVVSNLDAASVGGRDEEEPDANLMSLAEAESDPRFAPLYWVRLGEFDSHLRAFSGAMAEAPFAGAFFSPRWNDFSLDDERFDAYLDVLAHFDRVAVVHVASEARWRPMRIFDAVKRRPRTRVLLVGVGSGAAWKEVVEVASRCVQRGAPRIHISTSGAASAEVAAGVREAGAERWVFGSDALAHGADHVRRTRDALRSLQAAIPDAAYRAITMENANALFDFAKLDVVRANSGYGVGG